MEPRFEEFVWLPCIKLKITAKLLELLSHRNPCSDEAPRAVFELLLMPEDVLNLLNQRSVGVSKPPSVTLCGLPLHV